jgi:hypothetical protein
MLCSRCEQARAMYVKEHNHTPATAIRWAARRARRYERAVWMRRKGVWAKRVRELEMQVAMLRSQLMDQTKRDEIWQADFRKERKRIDAVIAEMNKGDRG